MGVTITNLIQGPASLWRAPFATAEPTDLSAEPGTGWADLGATNDGVNLAVDLEFAELNVDQLIDSPGRTPTKRVMRVSTNLAEATLANWLVAMNDAGTITDGAGTSVLEPATDGSEFIPVYSALLLRGLAPAGQPRQVVLRRALQIGSPGSAYKKDGQTLIPVEFAGHYISPSVKPFSITDATA